MERIQYHLAQPLQAISHVRQGRYGPQLLLQQKSGDQPDADIIIQNLVKRN